MSKSITQLEAIIAKQAELIDYYKDCASVKFELDRNAISQLESELSLLQSAKEEKEEKCPYDKKDEDFNKCPHWKALTNGCADCILYKRN